VAVFEGKEELMQLQFILLSILNLFFVDREFSKLASPEKEFNCEEGVLLHPTVFSQNPHIYASLLCYRNHYIRVLLACADITPHKLVLDCRPVDLPVDEVLNSSVGLVLAVLGL
jgi:hypothetical protein